MSKSSDQFDNSDCVCSFGMKLTWDINDPKLPQVKMFACIGSINSTLSQFSSEIAQTIINIPQILTIIDYLLCYTMWFVTGHISGCCIKSVVNPF